MSFMELAAAVGVACGAAVAVFTLLEKLTGVGTRWLAKGVEEGTRDLRADVHTIRDDQERISHLVDYHLGPNGGSPPIHSRIANVEEQVHDIRLEQRLVRHDLEDDDERRP